MKPVNNLIQEVTGIFEVGKAFVEISSIQITIYSRLKIEPPEFVLPFHLSLFWRDHIQILPIKRIGVGPL